MEKEFKIYNKDNDNIVTFRADESVKVGSLVKMSKKNFTVTVANDGSHVCDRFIGVCVKIPASGFADIQLSGYVQARSDCLLRLGFQQLCAVNENTVSGIYTTDCTYKSYLVVYSTEDVLGFIM